MQPHRLVAGVREAAFVVDQAGRIVAWNDACARLLGYSREATSGRLCCDLLCGRDLHGNRYCLTTCNARELARRGEPIRDFPLDLLTAEGTMLRVQISLEAVPGGGGEDTLVVHRLRPADLRPGPGTATGYGLTRRELEVLQLLSEGADAGRVAELLFISRATARTHIQHILKKMNAHSQAQAVALALRLGLA